MREVAHLSQVGRRDVGGYIQLDGLEIRGGLAYGPTKLSVQKVLGVGERGIRVLGEGAMEPHLIPPEQFRQRARIWTFGEYLAIPERPRPVVAALLPGRG